MVKKEEESSDRALGEGTGNIFVARNLPSDPEDFTR